MTAYCSTRSRGTCPPNDKPTSEEKFRVTLSGGADGILLPLHLYEQIHTTLEEFGEGESKSITIDIGDKVSVTEVTEVT